jgi:hypothetical protein
MTKKDPRDAQIELLTTRLALYADRAIANGERADRLQHEMRDLERRVRAAVHVADEEDVTDWQRGYRACAERVIAALAHDAGEESG